MNTGVGRARIGQWYLRWDKGELFQVTGRDDRARTIETQTFDGDLDEVDEAVWTTLPLGLAEPPEDWTGPMDDIETDDLGYSETDMQPSDWVEALEPVRTGEEEWEDARGEDERDPEGEARPQEGLALDDPQARTRLG